MTLITKFSFLGLMGKMGKNIEWNTGTAAVTTWKRRGEVKFLQLYKQLLHNSKICPIVLYTTV